MTNPKLARLAAVFFSLGLSLRLTLKLRGALRARGGCGFIGAFDEIAAAFTERAGINVEAAL